MAVKKVKVPWRPGRPELSVAPHCRCRPLFQRPGCDLEVRTKINKAWGYLRLLPAPYSETSKKHKILDDLGWFGTAFVLSEFCLDFFLLFLRAQRTSEFSGLHLGFAWEARQKTHSIKHIPIRFPSDGGLPFGNQRWQWKNHTISLGISQLATFDDNAGYTIGKIDSIFSFLNGQPLISAPQTK